MKWNKLTDDYKYLLYFSMGSGFIQFLNGVYEILNKDHNMAMNWISGLIFVIMAVKDAKTRKWNNQSAASGWWSLLGVAYPIAVSFKEKSWNSILWYFLMSIIIPIVAGFVTVFSFEFLGFI